MRETEHKIISIITHFPFPPPHFVNWTKSEFAFCVNHRSKSDQLGSYFSVSICTSFPVIEPRFTSPAVPAHCNLRSGRRRRIILKRHKLNRVPQGLNFDNQNCCLSPIDFIDFQHSGHCSIIKVIVTHFLT